jgi:hypothetical protein
MYTACSADLAPLSSLRTLRECIGTNKVSQKLLFSDINGYGFCIELGSLGCVLQTLNMSSIRNSLLGRW